ncbi:LOW QUALITY PROTEIN: two-component response regulator YesN [Bacillus sp. JCM 19046]|nr:LOW QUALITY PROTEIN: two-component response regulator YesN [Bacillus sp. JCM 19046]
MPRTWLGKLMVYGTLLATIPVIVVGVFAYFQSTSQVNQRVTNEKVELLRQVEANVEQVLTTINHSFTNTMESATMETVIRNPLLGEDFELYRSLRGELGKLQSFDTKVEEAIVVNAEQNWIASNQGIRRLHTHPDAEVYLRYLDLPYDTSWLLLDGTEFKEPIVRRSCPYTLSLVKKLPPRLSEKYGLAFANIPMCSILELIAPDGAMMMIVNEDNEIIVHSSFEFIGEPIQAIGYDDFSWPDEERGQFTVQSDQGSFTLTYSHSNLTGWKYVSTSSLNELTMESRSIGWFTFLVVFTLVAISTIAIWYYSRKLYSPVEELVAALADNDLTDKKRNNDFQFIQEKYKDLFSSKALLEHELSIHSKQSRSLFLTRLLQGQLSHRDKQKRLSGFKLATRLDKWSAFSVLVVHAETNHSHQDWDENELRRFALQNIIEDTVPECNRFPTVWIDELLVLIVGTEDDESAAKDVAIYNWSERISENVERFANSNVSIGISQLFKEMEGVHQAYNQAKEALTHRLKFPDPVIIHFNSVRTKGHTIEFQYPAAIEEELLLAVRIADEAKGYRLFTEWTDYIMKESKVIGEVHVSFIQLVSKLLRLKQESGKQVSHFYQKINYMKRYSNQEGNWKHGRKLLQPLFSMYKDISKAQFKHLSEKMIHYIHSNLDQSITLERCADDMHYNANYLGTVFKEETGQTFSEYAGHYRLKKAKDLLKHSELSIKVIAERVGYTNSQNFIRSFKKNAGLTPGQYRQEQKG